MFYEPTCTVCTKSYDREQRLPYVLSCGHVFCGPCINGLATLQCPTRDCRWRPTREPPYPTEVPRRIFLNLTRNTGIEERQESALEILDIEEEKQRRLQNIIDAQQARIQYMQGQRQALGPSGTVLILARERTRTRSSWFTFRNVMILLGATVAVTYSSQQGSMTSSLDLFTRTARSSVELAEGQGVLFERELSKPRRHVKDDVSQSWMAMGSFTGQVPVLDALV